VLQVFTTDTHFTGRNQNSYLNFLDYRKQNSVFTGMAGYGFRRGMTRGGETSNVLGQMVSGNYFDLLELRPFLGRAFLPEEDTAPNGHPVAVLSYKFWKKLGGDKNIIGDTITLNNRAFTVIGVAPPGYTGIDTAWHRSFGCRCRCTTGFDLPVTNGSRIAVPSFSALLRD
jgi:hypothetical protein